MSFDCWIEGKNREDLLKKYGIHCQLVGISKDRKEDKYDDREIIYDLYDIKSVFIRYKEIVWNFKGKEGIGDNISRYIVRKCQEMITANLNYLKEPLHSIECGTCSCPKKNLRSWSIEEASKFLSIPIEEVYFAYGTY